MNYDILHELIHKAQEYETQTGQKLEKDDLAIFSKWLYVQTHSCVSQVSKNEASQDCISKEEIKLEPTGETLDSIIGKFIGFMYRFAKFYTKKALEDSPLTTLDDFTYLGSIMLKEGSTKTEIIDYHIHEKTTGIEILKRLKKNHFITEKKSLTDGRSKSLFITEAGRGIFFAHVGSMQKIGELIVGDLQESEKRQLISLLNRLNDFHQPIYHENKKENIEQLLSFRKQ
ncbi:MarR family winged helix-turn-helix transcriptional regulator [Bernardetia sp. OM2101]|uniref:MarR family winged helix-turn-helix transcriptional regulator n=1 Tax=Bernardetia sp. OM2101 TaxID=3344876 RepID=UPI0035CFEF42